MHSSTLVEQMAQTKPHMDTTPHFHLYNNTPNTPYPIPTPLVTHTVFPDIIFLAHMSVFFINMATVIGPTPPGTGVIQPATWDTPSKSTSPTKPYPLFFVASIWAETFKNNFKTIILIYILKAKHQKAGAKCEIIQRDPLIDAHPVWN